jgi:uncharacterized membrane protein
MNSESKEHGEGSREPLRRLSTLTDCIFALCLILLVIFIEKPHEGMNPTEESVRSYLFGQLDTVVTYIISFINIAFYWFFAFTVGRLLKRSDGVHVWLTLISLMFVGLLPYTNALNCAFPESLTTHIFYSSMVFLVGLIMGVDWLYAIRRDRLVDRSLCTGDAEELIVESLVQPIAALLSIGGALIGTFWWELPFFLVPFVTFGINVSWKHARKFS